VKPVGTERLPLFEAPVHTRHRLHDSDTARAAAQGTRAAAKAQAQQIVTMLRAYGDLTNDEMDARAEWVPGTAGKRRTSVDALLTGTGWVYATTGEKRRTRRHHWADVWTLRAVRAAHQETAA